MASLSSPEAVAAKALSPFESLPTDLIARIVEMAAPLGELDTAAFMRMRPEWVARNSTNDLGTTRAEFILDASCCSKTICHAVQHLVHRVIVIETVSQAERYAVGLREHPDARSSVRGLIFSLSWDAAVDEVEELEGKITRWLENRTECDLCEYHGLRRCECDGNTETWDLESNADSEETRNFAESEYADKFEGALAPLLAVCPQLSHLFLGESIQSDVSLPTSLTTLACDGELTGILKASFSRIIESSPGIVHFAAPGLSHVSAGVLARLKSLKIAQTTSLETSGSAPHLRTLAIKVDHDLSLALAKLPQHIPALIELRCILPFEEFSDQCVTGIDDFVARLPTSIPIIAFDSQHVEDAGPCFIAFLRSLARAIDAHLSSSSSVKRIQFRRLGPRISEHHRDKYDAAVRALRKVCSKRGITVHR